MKCAVGASSSWSTPRATEPPTRPSDSCPTLRVLRSPDRYARTRTLGRGSSRRPSAPGCVLDRCHGAAPRLARRNARSPRTDERGCHRWADRSISCALRLSTVRCTCTAMRIIFPLCQVPPHPISSRLATTRSTADSRLLEIEPVIDRGFWEAAVHRELRRSRKLPGLRLRGDGGVSGRITPEGCARPTNRACEALRGRPSTAVDSRAPSGETAGNAPDSRSSLESDCAHREITWRAFRTMAVGRSAPCSVTCSVVHRRGRRPLSGKAQMRGV